MIVVTGEEGARSVKASPNALVHCLSQSAFGFSNVLLGGSERGVALSIERGHEQGEGELHHHRCPNWF